jgi:ectoine hydroxylase-related dioxygenase (phytanoyl-CoA dioxygenase family)
LSPRDLVHHYVRDGYVICRLLATRDVDRLMRDSDRVHKMVMDMTVSRGDFNLEGPEGGFRGQFQAITSHTGILRKISNIVEYSPAAADISRRKDVLALVQQLLGVSIVKLIHSVLWCKPPLVGSAKPPHQDAAYLTLDPGRCVTAWIAIDNCTSENGCLQISSGSHHDSFAHIGDELQVPTRVWQSRRFTDVPLLPGYAILFHPRLLHASAANRSSRPRRALMLRYAAL